LISSRCTLYIDTFAFRCVQVALIEDVAAVGGAALIVIAFRLIFPLGAARVSGVDVGIGAVSARFQYWRRCGIEK